MDLGKMLSRLICQPLPHFGGTGTRTRKTKAKSVKVEPVETKTRTSLLSLLDAWPRSTKTPCVPADITPGKQIAKGSYGTVLEGCVRQRKKAQVCPYVIKETAITDDDALETTLHDIYFLLWMQQRHGNASRLLTPRVHSVTVCAPPDSIRIGTISIVMERFETDMRNRMYIHPTRTFGVLTENDFLQMMSIAWSMDQDGVVQPDLKPDAFLWRSSDGVIVVTDFGLAGQRDNTVPASTVPLQIGTRSYQILQMPMLGWPVGEILECGKAYASEQKLQQARQQALDSKHPLYSVLQYMNLWQLHAHFIYDELHIEMPDHSLVRYQGLDESLLPMAAEQVFASTCAKYKIPSPKETGYRLGRDTLTEIMTGL